MPWQHRNRCYFGSAFLKWILHIIALNNCMFTFLKVCFKNYSKSNQVRNTKYCTFRGWIWDLSISVKLALSALFLWKEISMIINNLVIKHLIKLLGRLDIYSLIDIHTNLSLAWEEVCKQYLAWFDQVCKLKEK